MMVTLPGDVRRLQRNRRVDQRLRGVLMAGHAKYEAEIRPASEMLCKNPIGLDALSVTPKDLGYMEERAE